MWSTWEVSNPRPAEYKTATLPTELQVHGAEELKRLDIFPLVAVIYRSETSFFGLLSVSGIVFATFVTVKLGGYTFIVLVFTDMVVDVL